MKKSDKHIQTLYELVELGRQKDSKHVQIASLASAHQYLPLYRIFSKFVPKGGRALDWGAGIGHFSYFLCRNGYQATGFSLEDYRFKNWLKNYQYKFVKGKPNEPSKLPFKNNYFDAVVSVGVLEHVHEYGGDEISSLEEIYRILKPGGFFICYHLPNKYSAIEFLGKLLTKNYHHQYRFTKKDIKNLTSQTGYKLLTINRYGLLPRNSLGKLPDNLSYSETIAKIWNGLDNLFSTIFSPFSQNYYFVCQKPKKETGKH